LKEALPEAVLAPVHGHLDEIISALRQHRPDLIFNACEAPLGRPDLEAHVAAVLEWLNIPFTGSGSETLALCRNKVRTEAVLAAHGVPVPRRDVFPCIVKPATEDGSAYLFRDSICEDEASMARAAARIPGPVLVQEFLPGREFVISAWGRRSAEHVSIGEAMFYEHLKIFTYAAKWDVKSSDWEESWIDYQSEIAPSLRAELIDLTKRTWLAVDARGYLRLDIRLDPDGQPRVIDANPNAELGPNAGINRAAREAGWDWSRFVRQQVEWAMP
jgi:D-alanine-D-alanine ligase